MNVVFTPRDRYEVAFAKADVAVSTALAIDHLAVLIYRITRIGK